MTNCHWQCDEDTTPPYINDAVQYHWKTNHYLRGDIGEDWKAALSILSDSAPTEEGGPTVTKTSQVFT